MVFQNLSVVCSCIILQYFVKVRATRRQLG